MRVVDLDRDMRDVIPTGTSRDSEFLFERMTSRLLSAVHPQPGRRILDVASGFGQDVVALADRGVQAVGVEPSSRMTGWARLQASQAEAVDARWVRGWADSLPFADASFDGCFCKGAIDHFDQPDRALAEMARVTRSDGRVALAIANFDSLSLRLTSLGEQLGHWTGRGTDRGRRIHDVPSDHFTRYDLALVVEQASRHLRLESVEGVSLGWGLPVWMRAVGRVPEGVAQGALETGDWLARRVPALADVVIVAGRPRPHARRRATSR